MDLASVLASSLPGRDLGADPGAQLVRLWSEARSAWPDLPDDRHQFVQHLAAKLASITDVSITTALANIRAADLYLALHCAAGHQRAIECFLSGPFVVARATLFKLRCSPELADDVAQQVRTLLLVAAPGACPKIANYAGRGDLASWIASITARTARKRMHAQQRRIDAPEEDELGDIAASGDDPELEYFKDTYRDAFAAAVRDALAALSVRERNLLRQHHLDRLTLDELATLYGAHRATVARWLAAARERIAEETRALLVVRLSIADDELESVVRLVRSHVHVSLERMLAT